MTTDMKRWLTDVWHMGFAGWFIVLGFLTSIGVSVWMLVDILLYTRIG